jgi:hypothetical protein
MGGTCESITVGHNPSTLSLTKTDIFHGTFRPKFLCERIVAIVDEKEESRKRTALLSKQQQQCKPSRTHSMRRMLWPVGGGRSLVDSTTSSDEVPTRSSNSLKGLFLDLQSKSTKAIATANLAEGEELSPERKVLASMIKERMRCGKLEKLVKSLDLDGSGSIDLEEFMSAYQTAETGMTRDLLANIFKEADLDGNGVLDIEEIRYLLRMPKTETIRKMYHGSANRDSRGLAQIDPNDEDFFGQELYSNAPAALSEYAQSESQHLAWISMSRFTSAIRIFVRDVSRNGKVSPRVLSKGF